MFTRVVVGCDGTAEGRDAVVLGAAIASATGAGLSLVGVYPPAVFPVPPSFSRAALRTQIEAALRRDRDSFAPHAQIHTVADLSVPRALRHFAERWHADLVVLGSAATVPDGHARIGRRGRQLLYDAPFALALASRGLHKRRIELLRVGVGYDEGPEALAALGLATELAHGAQATLAVRRVIEDTVPLLSAEAWIGMKDWSNLWERERQSAQAGAEAAASHLGVPVDVSATVGDPGSELRALSESVDVVVVGSRRWGPFARLVAGGVGESLVTDAACSVVIVPRAEVPAAVSGPHIAKGART